MLCCGMVVVVMMMLGLGYAVIGDGDHGVRNCFFLFFFLFTSLVYEAMLYTVNLFKLTFYISIKNINFIILVLF